MSRRQAEKIVFLYQLLKIELKVWTTKRLKADQLRH